MTNQKTWNAAPGAWKDLSPWPWIPWVEGYYFRDPEDGKEKLAWGGDPVILDAKGRNICEPSGHRNAFLIATAPELLEALKREHTIHETPAGTVSGQGLRGVVSCQTCLLIRRAEGQGFREHERGAGDVLDRDRMAASSGLQEGAR